MATAIFLASKNTRGAENKGKVRIFNHGWTRINADLIAIDFWDKWDEWDRCGTRAAHAIEDEDENEDEEDPPLPRCSVPKAVIVMVDKHGRCATMTLRFHHGGAKIQLSRQGARPD